MLVECMNKDQAQPTRRTRFANWVSDLRHQIVDYPIEHIPEFRARVFAPPESGGPVPKTIVQTYRTDRVPRPIHSAVTRWQETNPEYDYRFFGDEAARQFISDMYPKDVLRAFDSLRPGAFRADLWRYCYLCEFGGVYVDIRMEPLLALRSILASFDGKYPAFVGVADIPKKRFPGMMFNAFIAAAPKHPFLVAAIERAVDTVNRQDYLRCDLDITGPGCLAAAVNKVLGRSTNADFEPGEYDTYEHGAYRMLLHERDVYHQEVVSIRGEPCIRGRCIFGKMSRADHAFP